MQRVGALGVSVVRVLDGVDFSGFEAYLERRQVCHAWTSRIKRTVHLKTDSKT